MGNTVIMSLAGVTTKSNSDPVYIKYYLEPVIREFETNDGIVYQLSFNNPVTKNCNFTVRMNFTSE